MLRFAMGQQEEGTGALQTVHRWAQNQWVTKVGRSQWCKTELGKQRAQHLSDALTCPSVGIKSMAS